jgi:hypothetical protein
MLAEEKKLLAKKIKEGAENDKVVIPPWKWISFSPEAFLEAAKRILAGNVKLAPLAERISQAAAGFLAAMFQSLQGWSKLSKGGSLLPFAVQNFKEHKTA